MSTGPSTGPSGCPVHQALWAPLLLGGVPRAWAIAGGIVTAVICLGLGQLYIGIPLGLAIHALGYALTKRDPEWLGALRRHIRHKPFLAG